jgi:hypothetical protein
MVGLKTFAVWSVSTARIYGCRNVAKPAPVLRARQVSRLFDVVIVGTGAEQSLPDPMSDARTIDCPLSIVQQ